MQGEGDANATMATAYQANLAEFITALRSQLSTIASTSGGKLLPETTWGNLKFFIGTIATPGTYGDTVRTAQTAVASADSNVHTVNATSGLTMMTTDDWSGSGIHYDTAGQVTLGERFYGAVNSNFTAYETWRLNYQMYSNAGFIDNPDGDSLINLQEFAFGINPTSAATTPLIYVEGGALTSTGTPIYVKDGTTNLAVFTRRKDYEATGLTYSVWFSSDLATWTQSGDTPTRRTSASDLGNYEAVSVPYPTSVPTPKFFKVGVVGN
jgi:hypothetical protein